MSAPAPRRRRPASTSLPLAAVVLLALPPPWAGVFAQPPAKESEEHRAARLRMVERELAREGITHKAVLEAMRQVPRHLFVPPEFQTWAYHDLPLPIGHKQTISPPYIVAYMTQALDPKPEDRVLEIGTGSGYQAAVLARLVKEVCTIEIVEPLGRQASRRLADLGYRNVRARVGDGYQGWPEHAPFDKIIVTCSPDAIPQPLADQLREGGTMLIPLGERFRQVFYQLEKRGGELHQTRLVPTSFVPMTGLAEKLRQKPVGADRPRLVNGGFERLAEGHPEGWFWKRAPTIVQGGAPEGSHFLTIVNADPGRGSGVFQAVEVDGSKVKRLTLSLRVRGEDLRPGQGPQELPCLAVSFANDQLHPVEDEFLGPWLGTFGWRRVGGTVSVPLHARVAFFRIGLNGGTGSLSVDDVRLEPVAR